MDGGGSAGAPAPFLLKTYEMVEDASTDEIVSWSERRNSFVVWNPPEFASVLLPTYFKHNNFSSFIRQLNTYGFRKIDAERWEFANDDFVQGKKHLLKNIHRKKPVYSHSQPPTGENSERSAMEEEIELLTRETSSLESTLSRFKDQKSRTKFQVNDLDLRLHNMEHRQRKMLSFVSRAIQNPNFVDHLLRLSNTMPIDLSEIHKKRRLPGVEQAQYQNPSSKLRLGLPSAISDSCMPSPRTQSSGEGFNNPERSSIAPETIEISDSAASRNEDEGDRHISCLLNLTLSSSPLQQMKSSARVNADGSALSHPGKVNDKFWEQFLTERPGSSDTEEANSALKVNSPEDHDRDTTFRRNRKDIDRLSL